MTLTEYLEKRNQEIYDLFTQMRSLGDERKKINEVYEIISGKYRLSVGTLKNIIKEKRSDRRYSAIGIDNQLST